LNYGHHFEQYGVVKVENDNRFHSADATRSSEATRLSNVEMNRWFVIDRLDGPTDDCRRLLDLGFTPGEEVAVTQASPLGDPIVIRIRGALLALRKREAAWIWVQQ
jgi:ferrous iron transport protein A